MTNESPDTKVDRLKTSADLARYLDVTFESGDTNQIADILGFVAKEHGMVRVAQETGLNRENLYRALSTRGNPRLATVIGVLKVMGLRLSVEPLNLK